MKDDGRFRRSEEFPVQFARSFSADVILAFKENLLTCFGANRSRGLSEGRKGEEC